MPDFPDLRTVYVIEVREEWRQGRGRYFRPQGTGYTDLLVHAGLWVECPDGQLRDPGDPGLFGPAYPAIDGASDRWRAIPAPVDELEQFIARVKAAAVAP